MDDTTSPSSSAMPVSTETVFGSHVLTIDGYTKTMAALAVGESIESDRFRVGGHSWQIRCCPRWKDQEGVEWLSVFLWLDRHGAALEGEVKARPKFILLDRAGKEIKWYVYRHVEQTFSTTDGPAEWGIAEFIERKALESYLLIQDDDCCRIRCDVAVVIREPPPSVPPPPGLGDLLLASEVGRDVTFVVDGELFTAHECVLAARTSASFMAEVHAGKQESAAGGGCSRRHVRVDHILPGVFRALLHFIYTDSLPDGDGEDEDEHLDVARDLLKAAHWYDMERLKMVCTDVLCSNIYVTTVFPTLRLSKSVRCLKLNQACVEYIRGMLDTYILEETNRWLQPRKDKLT